MLTPWQDPLATAAPTPSPGWEAVPGGGELQRRATAWYAQLRALPRRVRRALQRKLALPLAGVALLLALSHAPAQAATIAVDGTTCSLADAITAANTDMAQGGCLAGSAADILVLEPPGSTLTLTGVDNTTYGPTGLPVIRSAITIAGQGGTIARTPNAPAFRLLAVNSAGNLTLGEVTLPGLSGGVLNYNGTVTLEDSTISGNAGSGVTNVAFYGAATLTVIHSTIAGNGGDGVYNTSGWGGSADVTVTQSTISDNGGTGVSNCSCAPYDYHATVTLSQSTISGNSRGGVASGVWYHATVALTQSTISGNTATDGGGVSTYSGHVTVTQSTITGNTATGHGGGLYNNKGSVTLINSTISDNTASEGGGLFNTADYGGRGYLGYGGLTLTQSTIAGNTATGRGGGVVNRAHNLGNAALTLINSTISDNTASEGGGVVNVADDDRRATATLLQSTITGNTATDGGGGIVNAADEASDATLVLAGSLVAGNLAPTAPEVLQTGGTLTANVFNLFGVSGTAGVSGFTPGPTDVVPSEHLTAILDPILADNGGPTLTHALVPSSPAIDGIPWGTDGCGTTLISDQRWQAWPQPTGGACDIGAYEVEVYGQALGAWVTGVKPHTAVCENVTTGQAVTLNDPASPWDCEAEGLLVTSRDQVALRARGPVTKGATDVGGAVVGMVPSSGGCTNLTTGQQVKFQHMKGATAGSCVAAGLVIHPKDSVQIRVQGVAE